MNTSPRVVYVSGAMRSGTTLVGQVLASSPDTVLVGEMRSGVIDPHLHEHCDCGQARPRCPFWSGPDAVVPPADVARAASAMTALPALLASVVAGRPLTAPIRAMVDYLAACLAQEPDRVLVDTSKTPTLVPLWRLAGAQVHLVLAVRHPWHVAQAQARPTAVTGVPQRPVPLSLAVWAAYQLGTLVVLPVTASRTVARFRRFLADPVALARRVWTRAGLTAGTALPDGSWSFEPSHVLAGNPRRAKGTVAVRPRG